VPFPDSVESALEVVVEVALNGAPAQARQLGDFDVGELLAFQPEDFHLALHLGVGMMEAVVVDGFEVRRREREGAHQRLLS
jgi:hypothetical protein